MIITIVRRGESEEGTCIVEREDDDDKFYGELNAAGESRLLYHVKRTLQRMGHDVIKKRMHKDGHMVDEMQQYVRTREPTGNSDRDFAILNNSFALRGANEVWNEKGRVELKVVFGIFDE